MRARRGRAIRYIASARSPSYILWQPRRRLALLSGVLYSMFNISPFSQDEAQAADMHTFPRLQGKSKSSHDLSKRGQDVNGYHEADCSFRCAEMPHHRRQTAQAWHTPAASYRPTLQSAKPVKVCR